MGGHTIVDPAGLVVREMVSGVHRRRACARPGRAVLVSLGNPLVLGSASPRRFEILQQLAIPVRVLAPVGVDEQHHAGEAAQAFLERVVDDKLRAVAARFDGGPGILVADTLVLVDEQILGKPNDLAHAQQMLAALAGRTHQVCTRYAISDRRKAQPTFTEKVLEQAKRDAQPTERRKVTAKLHDTHGDDVLEVGEDWGSLSSMASGEDLELLYAAYGFDIVKGYHTEGNDRAPDPEAVDFLLLDGGWEE